MAFISNSYVATKNILASISPWKPKKSQQQQLTEQFLSEWASMQGLDPDKLLADTLAFTSTQVPFYKDYFAQNSDKDPSRLTDWPLLTRDHLCNDYERLQATTANRWNTWTHASGGSTGQPVVVRHDDYFAAKAHALRKLCNRLFFGGPYYNQLILWGMTAEAEKNISSGAWNKIKDEVRSCMGLKTTHINTFEFCHDKMQQCVRILRRQKPDFIFGYAGSIYELAKYLEDRGLSPTRPLKRIGTTAQTLHPFMRECIERVFQCKVSDHYGSREVGPAAWQHPDGDMCFPKFFSKVEVVDDKGNTLPEGEPGRILITTLHNTTMPLIRYDIGDIGILGPDKELEGYPLASLQEISGRTSEEFTNTRGSRICAPFFINLFYYRPWLTQFSIVQRDFDDIDILYIPADPHAELPHQEVAEMNEKIKSVMSEDCRITWKAVDKMPTTKGGKRLFIRSEVRPEDLPAKSPADGLPSEGIPSA